MALAWFPLTPPYPCSSLCSWICSSSPSLLYSLSSVEQQFLVTKSVSVQVPSLAMISIAVTLALLAALVPYSSSDALRCQHQGHQLFCLAVKMSTDGLHCITNTQCASLIDILRHNRTNTNDFIVKPPNPYRDPEVRITTMTGKMFIVLLDHSGFFDSHLKLFVQSSHGCQPMKVLDDPYSPNQECYSSAMIYLEVPPVNQQLETNFVLEKGSFTLTVNEESLVSFRVSKGVSHAYSTNGYLVVTCLWLLFTGLHLLAPSSSSPSSSSSSPFYFSS